MSQITPCFTYFNQILTHPQIFPSSSSPILQLAPFWCPEGHPIYSKALQTPLPPIPFNSLLPPSILDSIKDLMHLQAVSLLKLLPVSGTRALDSISMALSPDI
ncbi:hypothetical protein CDAR_300281 [Caerostris darwini]|uniref:Uncharacterized protein n=1 Tax=Caerostris darwini TaxID=1538125 RepID=A0AAV4NUI8_9ARAC|nr:hypothetical protein CDAR_300281 [Caerostris darwini]